VKDQSEQKSLPASDKKLRDARRKGQVPQSRDLVSGVALLAVVAYLLLTWTQTRDHILQIVDVVADSHDKPFAQTWGHVAGIASEAIAHATLPAVGVLLLACIISGIISTMGPVFSFETVKPNFEHINPVSGAKRIFSLRNLVEFLKGLVKVVLVGAALWLVLRNWLEPLLQTPSCGESCVVPVLIEAMKPIIVVALLAFLLIGMLDMALQRWLFLHEMRMTKTEMKRERKDMEGDPHIRGERLRIRRLQGSQSTPLGVKHATVVIVHGGALGAIRYHREQQPVPIVVARATAEKARSMREEALRLGITVVEDRDLAPALAAKHRPGDVLQRDLFGQVAGILVRHNLV
jgi:type III secretion protein U